MRPAKRKLHGSADCQEENGAAFLVQKRESSSDDFEKESSKTLSTKNSKVNSKNVPRMKTLDEIFAAMKNASNSRSDSPTRFNPTEVVDLTTPEPPQKFLKIDKKVCNVGKQCLKRKPAKRSQLKLKVSLKWDKLDLKRATLSKTKKNDIDSSKEGSILKSPRRDNHNNLTNVKNDTVLLIQDTSDACNSILDQMNDIPKVCSKDQVRRSNRKKSKMMHATRSPSHESEAPTIQHQCEMAEDCTMSPKNGKRKIRKSLKSRNGGLKAEVVKQKVSDQQKNRSESVDSIEEVSKSSLRGSLKSAKNQRKSRSDSMVSVEESPKSSRRGSVKSAKDQRKRHSDSIDSAGESPKSSKGGSLKSVKNRPKTCSDIVDNVEESSKSSKRDSLKSGKNQQKNRSYSVDSVEEVTKSSKRGSMKLARKQQKSRSESVESVEESSKSSKRDSLKSTKNQRKNHSDSVVSVKESPKSSKWGSLKSVNNHRKTCSESFDSFEESSKSSKRGSLKSASNQQKICSDSVESIEESSKSTKRDSLKHINRKTNGDRKNDVKLVELTQKEKIATSPKKKKKRTSSGVICVGEIKDTSKSEAKWKENYGLSPLPCESILWTEKYAPADSGQIIGNRNGVEKLMNWLKEWKERWEKEKDCQKINESQHSDSDSDFELDNDDKAELKKDNRDNFSKIAALIGGCGCGKTASVYACAKEMQFKVLEMSASAPRSSKQVLSQLHEATLSHQVSKSSVLNFFSNVKKASAQNEGSTLDSLILLKDVDVIFEEDKHFWSAVDTLANDTKRPIILTAKDGGVLVNLSSKHEKILFSKVLSENQLLISRGIAEKENLTLSEDCSTDFKRVYSLLCYDIRKSIHNLHFWGNVALNGVNSPETPRGRKTRKRSRSNQRKTKSPEMIMDLFGKISGIFGLISQLEQKQAPGSTSLDLLSAFLRNQNFSQNDIELVESVLSQMHFSRMPALLRNNWWSLVLCCENACLTPPGRIPLEIVHTPCAVDLERDFLYKYTSDDLAYPMEQDMDFLPEDENSNGTKPIFKSTSSTSSDPSHLDILSQAADMMCAADRIAATSKRISKINDEFAIDFTRCKVSDGLLDTLTTAKEMSHHSTVLTCDVLSALEVRNIMVSNSRLSSTQRKLKATQSSQKFSLCLPHEGSILRNNHRLRNSLQSQFACGASMTSQSFVNDVLPTVRAIVRSENRRKEAKKQRRFMHYFDTIRVFPKYCEMQKLLNDFKEIERIA